MKGTIEFLVAMVPLAAAWVLQLRLLSYRRDPAVSLMGGLRGLRPDQYTDDGQRLLRWLWLVVALTLPWLVGVFAIFGFA